MIKDLKNYQKILVGVFGLVLLLAIGWRIIGSRTYHPDMGINFVVVGESSVAIVGVSKNDESLIWVDLPSNLRVDGYPAVSAWGLGEIDGNSEELVLQSLGESLGLWLHVAMKIDGGEASLEGLLGRLLSLKGIRNLSWLDRYTLYKDLSSLSSKGIVLETSLPTQIIDRVQDVDGYEWLELNEAVYVWSRDLWPKMEVVNLGIKVDVVNTSDVPGAARVRARQLESVGFRVVGVEAGDVKIDKACLVRLKLGLLDKDDLFKRILRDYLDCDVETKDEQGDFTGDMIFFVGP